MRNHITLMVSTAAVLVLLGTVRAAHASNFSFSAGTLSCSATGGSTTDAPPTINTIAAGDYLREAHVNGASQAHITMNAHISPESFGVTTTGQAQHVSQFSNASSGGRLEEIFSVSDVTDITLAFTFSGTFGPDGFWRLENFPSGQLVATGGWAGAGTSTRTLQPGQYRLYAPFGFASRQDGASASAGITISVPEPTSGAALAIAGSVLAMRRKRR